MQLGPRETVMPMTQHEARWDIASWALGAVMMAGLALSLLAH